MPFLFLKLYVHGVGKITVKKGPHTAVPIILYEYEIQKNEIA